MPKNWEPKRQSEKNKYTTKQGPRYSLNRIRGWNTCTRMNSKTEFLKCSKKTTEYKRVGGTQSIIKLKNELGVVLGSNPSGTVVMKSIYPAEDVQSIQALYQEAEETSQSASLSFIEKMRSCMKIKSWTSGCR